MHRTTLALACGLLGTVTPAAAHDFWLLPQSFQLDEPGDVQVRFLVGHADEVNAWNLQWDRVVALRSHGGGEVSDLQPHLTPVNGVVPGYAAVALPAPGTHVVAFESHHSFSDLEADKFNDYAEGEGLTAVLEARERDGASGSNGRELYSRRAKTLLQVGEEATDDALAPLGHTLEIVPEANPYALGEDRSLPVRVMFRGEPLAGATVDITALGTGEDPFAEVVTDAEGRAAFDVPDGGAYKLNVVWGVPNTGSRQAEFETVFSSLTFGYAAAE